MRMNISIPDELRERMKPFDDNANWSAVAAEAFAVEVRRKQRLAEIDDPVKRRLELTELQDAASFEDMGHAAGVAWAKFTARKVHLRRLADAQGEPWTEAGPRGVAMVALNDPDLTWDDLNGPELPDVAALESGWLEGFVAGAIEVYDAL